MFKTAEAVSLGHPDKIADYISEYILDRFIERDPLTKYAVEVMVKNNTVVLGGEICSKIHFTDFEKHIRFALQNIGYNEKYAELWGANAIDINKLHVINLISCQSPEIFQGIENGGWGDQGVFVGYACKGTDFVPKELYFARKLNLALYKKALTSDNLGLDIKTQITLDDNENIDTAIIAVPMLQKEDLTSFVKDILEQESKKIIINGTGIYTCHSSIADCGITGRKLACDFYSTACPIGGGSPWAKDASKADVSLNILARKLAVENLKDNDEVFVYLSSCIGKKDLPSAVIKTLKNGKISFNNLTDDFSPQNVIQKLGLNKPIFAEICKKGITNI